jgi:peptidoglycan hydrolase FlgJ
MANAHTHNNGVHAHREQPHVAAFVQLLLPPARNVKVKWNVPIAVLIAQGALETGWGRHVKGNAYFGIKGKSSSGGSIDFATHENVGGRSVAITDSFRAYASLQEAADDYGAFLKGNKRYAACFAFPNDPSKFVDLLAAAGYATDPQYASKLKSIIRAHGLAAYDQPAAHA